MTKATNHRALQKQRVADTLVATPAILGLKEVSTFLGLTPNSILKRLKAGKFPQPVLVGEPGSYAAGWLYKDLIAYITTYIDSFPGHQGGQEQKRVADTLVATPAILGLKEVSTFLGLTPNSILKRLKAGKFPQPVVVGEPGSTAAGWLYEDLIAYATTYIDSFPGHQRETERPERLSDEFVRDIQVLGRYGDGRGGGGLSLWVKPTKIEGLLSRTFSQRVLINGRETNIGLGSYPEVTLEEARRRAKMNRQAIKQDRDPRINTTLTFREAYTKMLERRVKGLGPSDSPAEWAASFRIHFDPIIGDLKIDEISRQDIMTCLEPIWFDIRETATKLLERIRKVMRWAIAHGYIDSDPTDYIPDGLGPNPSRPNHRKSLPHDEVRPAIEVIEASGSGWAVKAAMKFLILTGTRSKEVRGLMWDEIDYFKAICSIPRSRRKNGQDFDLPICWAVFVVLDEALQHTGGVGLVFPSPRGKDKMLSDEALRYVLRANRIAGVPHGFRSSMTVFATEKKLSDANEKKWPDDIVSALLGHAVKKSKRAYLRKHPPEPRRLFMNAWATHVGFYSPPFLTRLSSPLPKYTATNPFMEADSSMLNELGE